MRAVLDPNVLVAALLSPSGTPARLLFYGLWGEFELVVSDELLAELGRTLGSRTVRRYVAPDEARAFVALLAQQAVLAREPAVAGRRSSDAGDDYLLALAEAERCVLVSGDEHLLALSDELPVQTPWTFVEHLETQRS